MKTGLQTSGRKILQGEWSTRKRLFFLSLYRDGATRGQVEPRKQVALCMDEEPPVEHLH